jgi:ribosomal protein S18 acetylase RimI-like enzyme
LFDIATQPAFRRQGIARALVQDLCVQGLNKGAKYAYLQVQEDNVAAMALYAALGFSPAYRYGYRVELL